MDVNELLTFLLDAHSLTDFCLLFSDIQALCSI